MTEPRKNPPLLGYVDHLSARPGDTLSFKVSSLSERPFTARLLRSICADPNPAGPGIIEEDASAYFATQSFPSVEQPFHGGSYGIGMADVSAPKGAALTLSVTIFPTYRSDQCQTILNIGDYDLHLDAAGAVALEVGDHLLSTKTPLRLRHWYRIEALVADGNVKLTQTALGRSPDPVVEVMDTLAGTPPLSGYTDRCRPVAGWGRHTPFQRQDRGPCHHGGRCADLRLGLLSGHPVVHRKGHNRT